MTEEKLLKCVGKNIKMYRIQRGILQQDLAAMCNMEIPNMSRIENGRTNPTLRTLYRISQALGVPVRDLLVSSEEGKGKE